MSTVIAPPLADRLAREFLYKDRTRGAADAMALDRGAGSPPRGLYPRRFCESHSSSDIWCMQAECLVTAPLNAKLQVRIGFLHAQSRRVGRLRRPIREWIEGFEPALERVPSLRACGEQLGGGEEAVERRFDLAPLSVGDLLHRSRTQCVEFPYRRRLDPVRAAGDGAESRIEAVFIREQLPVSATVELSASNDSGRRTLIRVRLLNSTRLEPPHRVDREHASAQALLLAHAVLTVCPGEVVSAAGPGADDAACRNIGCWTAVLADAGQERRGTLLVAPIPLDGPLQLCRAEGLSETADDPQRAVRPARRAGAGGPAPGRPTHPPHGGGVAPRYGVAADEPAPRPDELSGGRGADHAPAALRSESRGVQPE